MAIPKNSFNVIAVKSFLLLGTLLVIIAIGFITALSPYLGAAAAIFLFLLPVIVYVVIRWPELTPAGMMVLIYGLIPISNPKLVDLALISLFSLTLVFHFDKLPKIKSGIKPYLLPLGLFVLLAVVSTVLGYFYNNNWRPFVYSEARVFLYWLMFPFVAISLFSRDRIERFIIAMLVLSTVLALISTIQSLTGVSLVFGGGRLEQLETLSTRYSDVTRSIVPGILMIIFIFYILLGRVLLRVSNQWVVLPLCFILLLGIYFNFGRAIWALSLLGTLSVGLLLGANKFIKLILVGSVIAALALIILAVYKPAYLDASKDRIFSVQSEGGSGTSFGWRISENYFAKNKIEKNPFFGIGLGGEYRPPATFHALFSEQTRYIHNAYYYLALKLGVFSWPLLMWIALTFYWNGLKLIRSRISNADRVIVNALLIMLTFILFVSITQPELMSFSGVSFTAILLGLMAALTNSMHIKAEKT